jgi:hypothetical protein
MPHRLISEETIPRLELVGSIDKRDIARGDLLIQQRLQFSSQGDQERALTGRELVACW